MKKTILTAMSALLFTFQIAHAQHRTITGTITDGTDGSLLPGVSVFVKGTLIATLSNHQGTYTIEVPAGNDILVFSFTGMETQEQKIDNRTRIDVAMVPSIAALEEVVVTGYGTQRNWFRKSSRPTAGYEYTMAPVVMDFSHYHNTESYSAVNETGYKDVLKAPLSTFSIDVDQAAYSNVRRFINSGQLPPADAVRIEEMLNYFTYTYPAPIDEHPFSIYTELSQTPWNPNTQLLHIGLKGKEIDKSELPPSNLVFLIDVSGSMGPANRLPLVKTAMNMLVEELRPQDRVSIVVYASRTAVILPSTPASKKSVILSAINRLQAGGSTAGGQALRMAYQVAEENFIRNGNNRIIMCTDGDFNVGESSNAAMERLVEEKRNNGVYITVLGFGMGNYKDDRLEIIANKGNGNYGYIDNIQEARKLLVSEFAGSLFAIANDVKLQIEFNPARVKAYRLIGYENRRLKDEDFNDDTKDAGEMGAGHSVTALYEIIPAGSDFEVPGIDPLKYQSDAPAVRPDGRAELLTVKARYKEAHGEKSMMFDQPVAGRLQPLERTSEDFRFAAAITEFGLLLRNSPYKEEASFENILKLAAEAKGADDEGYRAEFINLVRTAQSLDRLSMER